MIPIHRLGWLFALSVAVATGCGGDDSDILLPCPISGGCGGSPPGLAFIDKLVTGEIIQGPTADFKVQFKGHSDTLDAKVRTFVLADSDADPVIGRYREIGTTTTAAAILESSAPYAWNVTSSPLLTDEWKPGGLLRLKAKSKYGGNITEQDLATFDNAVETQGCRDEACRSPYQLGTIITLVSTETSPIDANFASIRYLSRRGGKLVAPPMRSPNEQAVLSTNYYNSIGAPQTLDLFKTTYGFAGVEINAVYYNAGDLGVARDMHCWEANSDDPNSVVRACYVTNYGRDLSDPDTPPAFGVNGRVKPQDALQQALEKSKPIATVAMVHDSGLPPDRRVRFMVYGADEHLTPLAALDNPGVNALLTPSLATNANLTVPDNCLTCHGTSSTYEPERDLTVTNAHFLPFDREAFEFSTMNPDFSELEMMGPRGPIQQLNALVLETEPPNVTIELLRGMYPPESNEGPLELGPNFDPTFVPAGWSGTRAGRQLYNEVVKPYCRTCHTSHDATKGLDFLSFNALSNDHDMILQIASGVCTNNSTTPMPQSEQTQARFWNSPARAHLVNALSIGGACAPSSP
jgi:hypothetical protein